MGVFLDSWCKHTGSHMSYFETSAKDATNVAFAFNEMAEKALARITSEKRKSSKPFYNLKFPTIIKFPFMHPIQII